MRKVYYIVITISTIVILYYTYIIFAHNPQTEQVQFNPLPAEQPPLTEILIRNRVVDFGVVEGDTILYAKYTLLNNGNNPLTIYYVNPDCNCTSVFYSKEPIQSKDSTNIVLALDTKGKTGAQNLYSTIKVNTELSMYKLTMKVVVNR